MKKILLVLIVLAIIYFSLGFLASLIIIVIEFNTHQMSNEIGSEVEPWLIYLGLGVMALICGGIITACAIGFHYLRKNIRKTSV